MVQRIMNSLNPGSPEFNTVFTEHAIRVLLEIHGLVIGGLPGQEYKKSRLAIQSFTRLYIYSDGIYEVTRPDGSMLQLNDFINLVGRLSDKGGASPMGIIEEIRKLQDSDIFDDDVSLMEVSFSRPSP